jgi:TfoX/Sxy family transcriptional regulator of competence genes
MATDLDFVEFVVDQIENAGVVSYRKMFGEYVLYCKGNVVALICENQLFVKPTEAGRAYIGRVVEAPAYPGAKPSFLIDEEIEDKDWLSHLIRLTEEALPAPRPKKPKKKKSRKNN